MKECSGLHVDKAENGYVLRPHYRETDPKKARDMGWSEEPATVHESLDSLFAQMRDHLGEDEKPGKKNAMDKGFVNKVMSGLKEKTKDSR